MTFKNVNIYTYIYIYIYIYIYLFFFKFILNGQKNKGVECRYLSPYKSEVTGADVGWVVDEKYGWSACSETCAGGKLLLK